MVKTIVIIILAVLVLAVSGLLIWQDRRIQMLNKNISFLETLKLTGFPVITFENNGVVINMILDTGSSASIIDATLLSNLKHEVLEADTHIFGLSGTTKDGTYAKVPLTYKSKTYTINMAVIDMSDTFSKMKEHFGLSIHGILGTDFFSKYKYVLDFDKMVAYSK